MLLEIFVLLVMASVILWFFGVRWEVLAGIWLSIVLWAMIGMFIGASVYYFNQMMAGGGIP